MNPASIDLNCDLGEHDGAGTASISSDDLALLDIVTSANIACGGHAGDESSMTATVAAALARGVAVGAHPSYPDRPRFGRVRLDMPPDQIEQCIADQVAALARVAAAAGARLRHLKPHGALYHAAMTEPAVAEAIAKAARSVQPDLILVGLAGAPALDQWRGLGFTVASEAFADRRYEPDGSLRARSHPDALITDPAEAAAQAVHIVTGHGVVALDGRAVPLRADTICIHSDTPGAAGVARAVRAALMHAGVKVAAPAPP